jgi:hypothetical protein
MRRDRAPTDRLPPQVGRPGLRPPSPPSCGSQPRARRRASRAGLRASPRSSCGDHPSARAASGGAEPVTALRCSAARLLAAQERETVTRATVTWTRARSSVLVAAPLERQFERVRHVGLGLLERAPWLIASDTSAICAGERCPLTGRLPCGCCTNSGSGCMDRGVKPRLRRSPPHRPRRPDPAGTHPTRVPRPIDRGQQRLSSRPDRPNTHRARPSGTFRTDAPYGALRT